MVPEPRLNVDAPFSRPRLGVCVVGGNAHPADLHKEWLSDAGRRLVAGKHGRPHTMREKRERERAQGRWSGGGLGR